jgi:hypothetical protein
MIPLPDGWTMNVDGQPEKTVRLGAFGTLGLPENTRAVFERKVAIPAAWKGRPVRLVFDAEHWFWGLLPQAKLQINGVDAPIRQPIVPTPTPGFSFDVSNAAASGALSLRLEIDGAAASTFKEHPENPALRGQYKPHGVTGLFYVQASPPEAGAQALSGPWFAASAFNDLKPVNSGEKLKCLYVETRFKLPGEWPGQRLFLSSPSPLGFLVLNGCVLRTPMWMNELDISNLAYRDGRENVLRWIPAAREVANWNVYYTGGIPDARLVWKN